MGPPGILKQILIEVYNIYQSTYVRPPQNPENVSCNFNNRRVKFRKDVKGLYSCKI